MDGGVGHGRSLASGRAGRRPRSGSIAAMDALILADGDAPTRAGPRRAWPGWAAAVGFVVAADGGARHAAGARASPSTCGSATATRSARTGWPSSRPPACRSTVAARTRTNRTPSSPSTRRSGSGATGCRSSARWAAADRSRPGQRRPAGHARAGRSRRPPSSTRARGSRSIRRRVRTAAAVERPLPGRLGDLVSLLPLGDGVDGVTTRGLAYPLVDEPLPVGPRPRPVERPLAADAAVTVRPGLLLVVESPATLWP